MSAVAGTIQLIVTLGAIVIAILSFVGLGYLTKFSFSSADQADGTRCVVMSDTEKNLCRMTVVLQWIMLGLTVLSAIALGLKK